MDQRIWQKFEEDNKLTAHQVDLFKQYYTLLIDYNQRVNLTALTAEKAVIYDHFCDSLILHRFVDLNTIGTIADVGSGAGFPAIPLKILFPHLKVLLIEVNHKKQQFLKQLLACLGMNDVEVGDLDWRTFLRTTSGNIDMFVSRASLNDQELCRLFRHTSDYRHAQLVYWASALWKPHPKVLPYLGHIHPYQIRSKKRIIAFFAVSSTS